MTDKLNNLLLQENWENRPEVLDDSDGTGNNEGSEDAGEEDVDGVGDQPRKQQQPV